MNYFVLKPLTKLIKPIFLSHEPHDSLGYFLKIYAVRRLSRDVRWWYHLHLLSYISFSFSSFLSSWGQVPRILSFGGTITYGIESQEVGQAGAQHKKCERLKYALGLRPTLPGQPLDMSTF